MIRGRSGRVIPVIGGNYNEVVLFDGIQQLRQRLVEILKSPIEAIRVVPVSPGLVKLYHVGEEETSLQGPESIPNHPICLTVRGRMHAGDVTPREEVIHLTHAESRDVRVVEQIEQGRAGRRDAQVFSIRGPFPVSGFPNERTGDDPGDSVFACEHVAGNLAATCPPL